MYSGQMEAFRETTAPVWAFTGNAGKNAPQKEFEKVVCK